MNEQIIEAKYRELGYEKGWRFMNCPGDRIKTAKIAIITLNPGESYQPPPRWAMDNGVCYWTEEKWEKNDAGQSPLQIQIQRLTAALDISLKNVFSAQFIPFCSPALVSLPNRAKAIEFANALWTWTLNKSPADLLICIDKTTVGASISRLLNATLMKPPFDTGWGNTKINLYRSVRDEKFPRGRIVVSLPHLSRYKLFSEKRNNDAWVTELKTELKT